LVIRATERLAIFPRSGRVIPEEGREDSREVFVQNYRIVYQLIDDTVTILAIHHGARPYPGLP
jgi:toxin ParE1/3/4